MGAFETLAELSWDSVEVEGTLGLVLWPAHGLGEPIPWESLGWCALALRVGVDGELANPVLAAGLLILIATHRSQLIAIRFTVRVDSATRIRNKLAEYTPRGELSHLCGMAVRVHGLPEVLCESFRCN